MTDTLTFDNINQMAHELNNPDVVKQIEVLVDSAVTGEAMGSAKRLLQQLEPVVQSAGLDGKTRDIYENFLLRLKFIAFPLLDETAQKELLRTKLIYPFRNEIDLKDRVMRVFAPYLVGEDDVRRLEKFVKSVDDNIEILGQREIQVAGQSAKPTLGNWLHDYQLYLGQRDGDTFNTVNYITESKNVALLSSREKEILKDVLMFYNWLRYDFVHILRGEWSAVANEPRSRGVLKRRASAPRAYLPPRFSDALAEDVEEFSKTMHNQAPKELTAHVEEHMPKNEISKQKNTNPPSGYKLADILERAKMRTEAGLQIDPEQAKLIIQLINQQKKEDRGR